MLPSAIAGGAIAKLPIELAAQAQKRTIVGLAPRSAVTPAEPHRTDQAVMGEEIPVADCYLPHRHAERPSDAVAKLSAQGRARSAYAAPAPRPTIDDSRQAGFPAYDAADA